MRRFGMGVGISKAKLSAAMLEVLLQLPTGTIKLNDEPKNYTLKD